MLITLLRRAFPTVRSFLGGGAYLCKRPYSHQTHPRSAAIIMGAEELEAAVLAAQEAVNKQGDTVRSLKAELKEGKVEKVRELLRRWVGQAILQYLPRLSHS